MKQKLTVLSIFIVMYVLFFYIHTNDKNQRINLVLNKQIKILETHYGLTKDYFLTDAKSIKENMSNNKTVIDIFSKAQNASEEQRTILRKELYNYLEPLYNRIKMRGVLQFHFVFANNISFLRMHKPDKFGDDLTNIRYSFKYTNETKHDIEGFEQGRTSHAFRYVFPFYDKQNNHIGAIDISLSSFAVQNKLLNVNKIHSHLLINKDVFSVKEWEIHSLNEKYIQSIENKNYMYALNFDSNMDRLMKSKKYIIKPLKEKISQNITKDKPFALYIPYKNNIKVITFLPIKNAQHNKTVAYVVAYSKNGNINNILKNYKTLNIVILFSMIFLFYFILKNIDQKRKLLKQSEDLKNLNNSLEERISIEVKKSKEKDQLLFEQSKMAAMGEMLESIAHQWRQPLSVITTASSGIKMQKEFDMLSDQVLITSCDNITNSAKHLSETIDDFRNFFKQDKEKKIFNIADTYKNTHNLLISKFKNKNIDFIDNIKDVEINGFGNELVQVFMNILNNARDELIEKKNQKRVIFIDIYKENNSAVIKIKDNAGGIPNDILPKIFDARFTTKEHNDGTGIGLYMTKRIIVNNFKGSIEAINAQYDYEDIKYKGACFIIKLPLD